MYSCINSDCLDVPDIDEFDVLPVVLLGVRGVLAGDSGLSSILPLFVATLVSLSCSLRSQSHWQDLHASLVVVSAFVHCAFIVCAVSISSLCSFMESITCCSPVSSYIMLSPMHMTYALQALSTIVLPRAESWLVRCGRSGGGGVPCCLSVLVVVARILHLPAAVPAVSVLVSVSVASLV
jgi:hypothetical protein